LHDDDDDDDDDDEEVGAIHETSDRGVRIVIRIEDSA